MIFAHLAKTLPCLEEPVTGLYPEEGKNQSTSSLISYTLRLGLPRGLSLSGFSTKLLDLFGTAFMLITCPNHVTWSAS